MRRMFDALSGPSLMAALAMLTVLTAPPALAQSRGAVTDAVDRFVLDLFDRIQPRSIAENREYCGLIGFDGEGTLAATGPNRGTEDGCDPGTAPAGWEIIASYHTHGAFLDDADSEVPSLADLLADFAEGIDGYVATPGGRVWLNLVTERLTFQLCGRGCVLADPEAHPCPSFVPRVEYTLPELRERAETDPGTC